MRLRHAPRFLRDLVPFEHVLQRLDLEAHLVGESQQHQDLVGAVAVRVHETLALEDLHERLELQIARRRDDVLAGGLLFFSHSRHARW